MISPLRRAVGAVAALVCVLLVAVGCTGTPAPDAQAPTPDRVVADAVSATLAAGTARLSADLASPVGPVTASGPVRFSPFAADLSADAAGRPISVRTIDDRSWIEFAGRWRPVATGLVPVGALPGAVRAASSLRDVTADGVDASGSRYRGTVDLDALAASDPAASGPLRELSALVTPRPGVEVWVGPDGRVPQVRLTPPGAAPVTVRLTDLGLPVDVTPPPT